MMSNIQIKVTQKEAKGVLQQIGPRSIRKAVEERWYFPELYGAGREAGCPSLSVAQEQFSTSAAQPSGSWYARRFFVVGPFAQDCCHKTIQKNCQNISSESCLCATCCLFIKV